MIMRILIVDDSEDWRDLTEAALLAAGYDQVATAESAKKLVEAARSHKEQTQ